MASGQNMKEEEVIGRAGASDGMIVRVGRTGCLAAICASAYNFSVSLRNLRK